MLRSGKAQALTKGAGAPSCDGDFWNPGAWTAVAPSAPESSMIPATPPSPPPEIPPPPGPRSATSAAGRGARGAGRADHPADQAGHGASAGARQRPASGRRPGTRGIGLPSPIEHVAAGLTEGRYVSGSMPVRSSRPLRGQTRHSCHGMQSSESQLRAQMPCSRSWAVAGLEVGWIDRQPRGHVELEEAVGVGI